MEMNLEKMAIEVTEKVLDDLLYKGKTLREWIDLIIKFEKEYKILPMGKYPASISGCNMEEDKNKNICNDCVKKDTCKTVKNGLSVIQCNEKKIDTRFICITCKRKKKCQYYEYVKEFIEQNPNNDMKCELYIK